MQNKWSYGKIVFSVLLVITFVIVGIMLFFRSISGTTDEGHPPIYLNGSQSECYYRITFGEMQEYGLAPKDAVGFTKEHRYEITMDDLGEPMGTVTDCLDRSMVKCRVYHFAKFPDDRSICIVDTLNGYQFYTLYPYD